MPLTPAQQATLKTAIQADPAFNTLPANNGSALTIANAMNLPASPTWTVWKPLVTIGEIGRAFNGAELAALTTGNQTRLLVIATYHRDGFNPSISSNRAFFDDVFSGAGGTNTRAALLALWKRTANRVEKTLSISGAGSDAVPAIMGYEGTVTYQDIVQAMGWPY